MSKRTKKEITKKHKSYHKVTKPYLNKALRYFGLSASILAMYLKDISVFIAKKTRRYSKKTSRFIHHHTAVRPHNHFMDNWAWYEKWHSHKHHKHTHLALLAAYIFVIGALVLSSYKTTQALSDLSDNWDFTNAADFTLDSGVETNGSSVRLKAQNYSSDSHTSALYHFDEAGGADASDSSSHNNDGVVENSSFGNGNLNNALSFNGTSSKVRADDSASLSLSQQNSIESWTKFNSSFSADSTDRRQSIVDKGDYQLYYDNETGKVTYELADSNADSWSLAGGNDTDDSWDQNGKRSVNALTKMGSNIYAGLGVDVGDAEVWKWDGSDWTKIGGGPGAVNDSWDANTYEGVYALATDGTNLYAGLGLSVGDGEVWKWDGSDWTKIGGDSTNNGWTNYAEQIWTMDYFGGKLYAGIGSSANDAEVWEWNGSTWNKIGGDSANSGWTTNYEMVASLSNDGTNLYAGLGLTAGDGEVWRWNGSTWTKIGGDGINSGWDATIETVRSLRWFGGKLYAGLGDTAGDADVWSWNGTAWSQIGGDGMNSSWAASTYEQIGGFAYDGTNLYAGLGTGNGDGEVWRWNGTSWSQIGGDGMNSSWPTAQGDTVNTLLFDSGTLYSGTYDSAGPGQVYSYNGTSWSQIGGEFINNSWGFYGVSAVQVMQNVGDYLYAGLGNTVGTSLVWRFDGNSWTLVGGQGINGSWAANTYEQVMSMASYNGHLFVGLGTSANDAEVWEFDGNSWTKVGGDSLNSGWTTNFEEVDSLASYGGYLYAGLGASASDAEVWRYNGSSWTKIGGDNLNSGWNTGFERVLSMAIYNGKLVAGLGSSAGDGEVWEWNGSAWARIGGDGINSSWANSTFEEVESLIPYNGKLYAGLGLTAGDAGVWEWNGTSWSQIGGDDINGSWTPGTYEKVKTMAVYNGNLFAGLGNTAGDADVWRYNGSSWTKIGGNSLNGSWTSAVEEVESFSAYKGKFYAGTGLTANADGLVWSWGNNAFLQSDTDSFDTNWHHIAASYDGSSMKLYIDGQLDSSKNESIFLPDGSKPLLIGAGYGGREAGKSAAYFDGQLDEIRISDIARSSFTSRPYVSTEQAVTLTEPVRTRGVWHWDNLSDDQTADGGSIKYRLSDDGGSSWKYWDGDDWTASGSLTDANPVSVIDDHIDEFPVTFAGIKWQAVLKGNGSQRVTLNSVTLASTSDVVEPSANASNMAGFKTNGGSSIASDAWTNGSSPYFTWDAAADAEAGIKGYCLYLGTDNSADPVTTKGILGVSPVSTGDNCQFMVSSNSVDLATPGYINTALATSDSAYYLIVKAIDKAGNVYPNTAEFHFRFDNQAPSNPGFITAPSGFINTKAVTLSWPTVGGNAPDDDNSGLAGLQYKIGSGGTWYGDSHTGSGDAGDLLVNDGAYVTQDPPDFDDMNEGINNVYFRSWDQAGNVTSSYISAALKINTSGAPSEPLNLQVNPATNTSNSFGFSWDAPTTFVGDENNLTYCYTINTLPNANTCTFTENGVTSLDSGPYATQPGDNTLYLVAKDESNNINYSSYSTVQFNANTPSPGIPLNTDIVDVSIKATSNWRLALTWEEPNDLGAGVDSYKVYRSTDQNNYTFAGSSSSTTYIDAGLSQQRYYYKVRACDSANNCGADSTAVDELPTGKFTSPAGLVAKPIISDISTTKAKIIWSTDRNSDSKIALGTESGKYSPSEIGNSDQVSSHEISLNNLAAGTTYYFKAKWTDEDGNSGSSQEMNFRTAPAPIIKEISALRVGLTNATIQFTSKGATKASVYFGKSESFGGLKTINTSLSESTYAVDLSGLDDGSKYFYKITSYDSEGNAYDGNVLSFETPPRPAISNLRFEPVRGEPTSTQRVTWDTNVSTDSAVTYGIAGGRTSDIVNSKFTTQHEIIIKGLLDDSEYSLIAHSRDNAGNLATSDEQSFRTALDTRPPKISEISVESSIRGSGAEARGQIIVSWHTDEPSTSQVAYSEGSNATVFNSRTPEDTQLSTEHVVIVSDLPTSRVYSVQPVSRDRSGNAGTGEAESAIIGRASDSVLTIILNTLQKVFGF